MKRLGAALHPPTICYAMLIVYSDWRRHLSKVVKSPHELHRTPHPPTTLRITPPSSYLFLPSLPVCTSLTPPFFPPPPVCHMHLPRQHHQRHGTGCGGMKCTCRRFNVYVHSLPHAVLISLAVSWSLSLFLESCF